jgi:hypothetical protein
LLVIGYIVPSPRERVRVSVSINSYLTRLLGTLSYSLGEGKILNKQ